MLLAPWHDAVWSSPAVRRVAQQLLPHQSRLSWCRFQLRPSGESEALSDRSDKLLSSFKMPALDGRCAHSRAIHRRDWRITDDDPEQAELRRLRDKQHASFIQLRVLWATLQHLRPRRLRPVYSDWTEVALQLRAGTRYQSRNQRQLFLQKHKRERSFEKMAIFSCSSSSTVRLKV